jgi:hypothetical protein
MTECIFGIPSEVPLHIASLHVFLHSPPTKDVHSSFRIEWLLRENCLYTSYGQQMNPDKS